MGTTYGIAQFAPSQIIRQRVCVSVCVCVQHLHTNFSFMGCHLTFAVSGPRFEVFPLLTCGQLKCAAFNFFNFNSEAHSLGGLSLLPKTSFSYGRSCHLSRSLLSAGLQPRAWSWAHEIHARARYIYIYIHTWLLNFIICMWMISSCSTSLHDGYLMSQIMEHGCWRIPVSSAGLPRLLCTLTFNSLA